jgi:hypothetical protein
MVFGVILNFAIIITLTFASALYGGYNAREYWRRNNLKFSWTQRQWIEYHNTQVVVYAVCGCVTGIATMYILNGM